MKAGTVVEVVWEDHAFHRDYTNEGLACQRSVGFLVSEDEHTIRVAQTMTTDEGGTPYPSEVLVVDKRMLVHRPKRVR